MKKLIDLFNKKYGSSYGVIDDSIDNEDVYKVYKVIKTLCADDEEIMDALEKVKLPNPKTAKESIEKININVSGGGGTDPSIKEYVDERYDEVIKVITNGLPLRLNVTEEELESVINLEDNTYTILSSISPNLIKSTIDGDNWYSTLILNDNFVVSIKSTGSIISSITCIESGSSINMQYTDSVYRAYNDLPFIDVYDFALCVITLPDGVESVAFAKGVPKRYNMATKKYVDDNKFSGNYNDLTNKPTIPTKTSDLTNDSGYAPINSPDFTGDIALNRKTGTKVGTNSVALGYNVEASGANSFAQGNLTIASSGMQFVQGKCNIEDTASKYLHIVGNGKNSTMRSNAYTLDWDGNAWYAGNISISGTPTNDNDLITKKYVDDKTASLDFTINNNLPSNGSLTLTTNKLQTTTLATPTEIILPTVTGYTEIHLYFAGISGAIINTPDTVKWKNTATIEDGKTYEVTFTYINDVIGWLAEIATYSTL